MHLSPNDGFESSEVSETDASVDGSHVHAERDSDAPATASSKGERRSGSEGQEEQASAPKGKAKGEQLVPNNVRKIRIERMMSKAELARRANLSVLTIDRVEKGFGCRMNTKRKILEALGLSLADRVRVFGEEE